MTPFDFAVAGGYLDVKRGCAPTLAQHFVEQLVEAAERATSDDLPSGAHDTVSESMRLGVVDLAGRLAELLCNEAEMIAIRGFRVPGLLLSRPDAMAAPSESSALLPYRAVLATHGCEAYRAGSIFDGYGPAPFDHLDRVRYLMTVPGLLQLAEREAEQLVDGEDFNWGDAEDPDADVDDDWHPEEMLRFLRAHRASLLAGWPMASLRGSRTRARSPAAE